MLADFTSKNSIKLKKLAHVAFKFVIQRKGCDLYQYRNL